MRKKTRVSKQDLIGQRFDNDASIVRIDDETGDLLLVHVEGFLANGHGVRFNGEIRLSLKNFEWID